MNVCIYTCVYTCTVSQRSVLGFVPQEHHLIFWGRVSLAWNSWVLLKMTAVDSRNLLPLQHRGTSVCCHIRLSLWVLGTYLRSFAGVHGADWASPPHSPCCSVFYLLASTVLILSLYLSQEKWETLETARGVLRYLCTWEGLITLSQSPAFIEYFQGRGLQPFGPLLSSCAVFIPRSLWTGLVFPLGWQGEHLEAWKSGSELEASELLLGWQCKVSR